MSITFDDEKIGSRVAGLHTHEVEEHVRMLGAQMNIPYINLIGVTINPEAISRIPEAVARNIEMVAFTTQGMKLFVGMKNPRSPQALAENERLTGLGYTVVPHIVSEASLQHAYLRYKDIRTTVAEDRGGFAIDVATVAQITEQVHSHLDVDTMIRGLAGKDLGDQVSGAVSIFFGGAQALDASDIHIEPEEEVVRIRYRIDGVLWEVTNVPKPMYQKILSRIKLLSGMKLNVHNEAQDGRLSFSLGEQEIDVRVSIIPGGYGESIVMRLLNPDASRFKLSTLGLNDTLLKIVNEELHRPNGAIITTGPTGSGKTTALYAFLLETHKPGVKIITIEDPIEYKLPGIVQTQTGEHYTFATGLRAILRQDPDIVMIGEIRDFEVAETAVHAALTGHLVFSTLHTNSAIGAIPRLIDIGIEPSIIGSAFNLILGQRLARRLCESCKVAHEVTAEEQKLMMRILGEAQATTTIYEAKGCPKCAQSGYKGRIGIYEAVKVTPQLAMKITKGVSEPELRELTRDQGIPNMQQDGVMKVQSGITSLDELTRVIDLYN